VGSGAIVAGAGVVGELGAVIGGEVTGVFIVLVVTGVGAGRERNQKKAPRSKSAAATTA
jgi:hypothetical protein